MFGMLKRAFAEWREDDCQRMAAAMSYYTTFALPPLLLILLMLAGLFVDPERVSGRLQTEIGGFLGPEGARQIETMIRNVNRPGTGGPLVATLSVVGLLFGATGAFNQLQDALNRAWEVAPDPEKGGIMAMIGKRILSLGMAITIALLLLVGLVLSAVVTAVGDSVAGWLPGGLSALVLQLLNVGVSLVAVTFLFALVFRVVPDAKVAWSDVWLGAAGTAVLFVAGEVLLSVYFSRSDPGEAFGAAGSLAVVLVWIYYSAMIVFYGAELTKVWAVERGSGVRPTGDAVRMVEEKRHIREGEEG